MSDLISREEAIEAIQNAYCKPCKERGDDHNEVRCRACEYDNAIIQIDALPSADTEWIPCNERLPNVEDCPMDCMVTRRSKYVGNYTDMAVAEADGTWTHEDWKAITIKGEATCISTRDADIVAWMPLPEPYREEKQNG